MNDDDAWEGRMNTYMEEAERQIAALRAERDRLAAENAALRADAARWRWLCEHHPAVLAKIAPAPDGLVVRLLGREEQ